MVSDLRSEVETSKEEKHLFDSQVSVKRVWKTPGQGREGRRYDTTRSEQNK